MLVPGKGGDRIYEDMAALIHKIHEVEELLYRGDGQHLEELKQVSLLIDEYISKNQGQKFEPRPYQNLQVQPGQQGASAYYGDHPYPEYPQDPRRGRDISGHIGYRPFYPNIYPIYPLYNEDRSGRDRGREGYTPDYYDRRRR